MAEKQPTFEEALKQLEAIAEQIEQGRIGLEESISKYEEGMKLVQFCRSVLDKAEQKIERLQITADGEAKIITHDPARDPPPDKPDTA